MKKTFLTMLLVVCVGMLSACGDAGSPSGKTAGGVQAEGYNPVFAEADADASWDAAAATRITFDGANITVNGEGANALEGGVKISMPGVYVLEGTLTDGRLIAEVEPGEYLKIVLNGVNMSCSTSAPIYIANGDAIIVLADGTNNVLNDAQVYHYADSAVEEPNACLYADDNLSVVGGGALTVNANFNNGIGSKDELRISGATLSVTAANNAIKGKDCVLIRDAQITLKSYGDGIKSDEDKKAGHGIIEISGSKVDITAVDDALQAITRVTVPDGEIITAVQGDKVNCNGEVSIAEGVLQ